MICYFCDQQQPGGTTYGHEAANGICQHCGVGICSRHGRKAAKPGSPFLCFECAELLVSVTSQHALRRKPVARAA